MRTNASDHKSHPLGELTAPGSITETPLIAPLSVWQQRLGLPPNSRVLRKEIAAGRLRAVRLRPGSNAKLFLIEEDVATWLEAAREHAIVWRK